MERQLAASVFDKEVALRQREEYQAREQTLYARIGQLQMELEWVKKVGLAERSVAARRSLLEPVGIEVICQRPWTSIPNKDHIVYLYTVVGAFRGREPCQSLATPIIHPFAVQTMGAPQSQKPMNTSGVQTIVFFDGVCKFCNGVVNFLLDHDKLERLVFATLQGAAYQEFQKSHTTLPADISSIVVVSAGNVYVRSAAALRVAWLLGGIWRVFVVFWIVPSGVRDAVYDIVARNRYAWFGKTDACRTPTPHERTRFLA
jgi:predicted DCC family thiol-disulfide oxidoreductase YuxK